MNDAHRDCSTNYTTKQQSNQEKAIGLARLAGSAKLTENVDLIKIMSEAKGK
ncbi:hypothetical protein P4U99_26660 [Brevibacillus agri]|uniref:hypothetical protein n=1 Tax=Brevibacillus TaxID=55080 RepID=UPI001EE5830B|nr:MULTISPECIES: hypothetical protein [Brevibacillus]MCG5252458.1 hypothetical protein [Brevibacillus agri]MCM3472205.1 hypothetical protein [Brevibacillus borstelensis]MED1646696.1 hypothetical protein [Brevibacillus agri]MED1657704.1 hypothetical protein [Brevibacillus agri]MED1689505.1 hypothetical protein [Brevibacillus agri]